MFRFCKLFGNQYLGFWVFGLVLFAVQEIPYIIMPLIKPEPNPIMTMQETSPLLDIAEKLLGSLCIAFMTFIVSESDEVFLPLSAKARVFFALAATVLIVNFIGWGIYFAGQRTLFVMMFFIVLMPPLYYVCVGLWRNNIPLTITGSVFTIVHFVHVYGNLKK